MANHLYNGVELPNINDVWTDKEAYPYAVVYKYNGEIRLYTSEGKDVFEENTNHLSGELVFFRSYKFVSDSWIFGGAGKGALNANVDSVIWANHDIIYSNSNAVYLATSEPISVEEKVFIKISTLSSIAQSTMRKRRTTSITFENAAKEIDNISISDEEKEQLIAEAIAKIPNAEDWIL